MAELLDQVITHSAFKVVSGSHQTLTSNGEVLSITLTDVNNQILFTVEATSGANGNSRYTFDGTDPTNTAGFPLKVGSASSFDTASVFAELPTGTVVKIRPISNPIRVQVEQGRSS